MKKDNKFLSLGLSVKRCSARTLRCSPTLVNYSDELAEKINIEVFSLSNSLNRLHRKIKNEGLRLVDIGVLKKHAKIG